MNPEEIEAKIENGMTSLNHYLLTDNSIKLLKGFINIRLSPLWQKKDTTPQHFLFFADKNTGDSLFRDFHKIISSLPLPLFGMYAITEDELLSSPEQLLSLRKEDFLMITDFSNSPMTDDELNDWNTVAEYAKKSECPTLFLIAKKEDIDSRIPYNNDVTAENLYYSVFNNHIFIRTEYNEADIIRALYDLLDNEGVFFRSYEFNDGIEKYITTVYPKARLRNMDFVYDLKMRIDIQYFSNVEFTEMNKKLLDAKSVPFYKKDNIDANKSDNRVDEVYTVRQYINSNDESANKKTNNILILSLSTINDNNLSESKYSCSFMQNEITGTYYYQLEPVPYMLIDKIGASEESLEIIMLCTKKVLSEIEFSENGKRVLSEDDTCCSIKDYFISKVSDYAPDNIDLTFKAYGGEDETNAEIINNIISEIRHQKDNNPDVNIYVDIHGGYRDTQELLNSILSLLHIENININKENIYTVRYDRTKKEGIIETAASETLEIFDFISGINECINYGQTRSITKYFKNNTNTLENALVSSLAGIAEGIQLCDIKRFEDNLKKLSKSIIEYEKDDSAKKSYLYIFLNVIKDNYNELLDDSTRSVIKEVEWCTNKGFYQQALTLIESKMPEVIIKSGLLRGSCFDENNEITQECSVLINDMKKKWQSKYNYLFEEYGYKYNEWEKYQKDKKNKKSRISTILKNIEHGEYLTSNQKTNRANNYLPYIESEKDKRIRPLTLLHMILKDERNNTNHASNESRIDVETIDKALKKYIKLATELKLDKVIIPTQK